MFPSTEPCLDAVRHAFDEHRFVSGDCHNLAIALHVAHGRTGRLFAALRHETDAIDGTRFSTTYSHMIWEDPFGNNWDIEGLNADVRWIESFPNLDDPDENGLLSVFDWIELDYSAVESWLEEHRCHCDSVLIEQLIELMRHHVPSLKQAA